MTQRSRLRVLTATALLAAAPALADRAVVLEIAGDTNNQLHDQIEAALRSAGKLEVISTQAYKDVAAKHHLKGDKAMTPKGVAKVSRWLPFEVAVGGAAAQKFFVQILDSNGQELWSKDLPMEGALLSADNSRRLASAIAAAAGTAPHPVAASGATQETEGGDEVEATVPERQSTKVAPGLDVSKDEPEGTPTVSSSGDADLEAEMRRKAPRVGPRLVHVELVGTTTWRSYCSAPGATTCNSGSNPPSGGLSLPGPGVSPTSYPGVTITGEVFPFASFDNLAKGIGVEGTLGLAWSSTTVTVVGSNAPSAPAEVSTDTAYDAMVLARYFFGYGDLFSHATKDNTLAAHVGLRGGLRGRSMSQPATSKLTAPSRTYPALGLDASVPFVRWVRLEAQGLLFVNPGPGADVALGYGNNVSSSGWALQAGLAGDVWQPPGPIFGPLGYVVRFRYETYSDTFSGPAQLPTWPSGGVELESYATLYWGASIQF